MELVDSFSAAGEYKECRTNVSVLCTMVRVMSLRILSRGGEKAYDNRCLLQDDACSSQRVPRESTQPDLHASWQSAEEEQEHHEEADRQRCEHAPNDCAHPGVRGWSLCDDLDGMVRVVRVMRVVRVR